MKTRLMESLKFILTNWQTSLLGLVVLIATALWIFKQIATPDFLSVLGFCSGVGLFAQIDPKFRSSQNPAGHE
jgi:hypothetical protein